MRTAFFWRDPVQVITRWGRSPSTIDLTIVVKPPQQNRTVTRLDVTASFNGNLSAAVAAAATAVAKSPDAAAELVLGDASYQLSEAIILPPRTSMVGNGFVNCKVFSNL